jgi:RNA polymerase sigma-70 factor, ECF subfamily
MTMTSSDLNQRKDEIEALVVRVKEGDGEAFAVIYDILVDYIYRYVYYRVDKSDAEDLVEMVFLKVWENIGKYKPKKRAFTAWVFRIAHNLVVDYYRSAKDRAYKREHNPIRVTEHSMNIDVLKKAMGKLKKNYQEIILHKFINELSNPEIARILKKSEGSLRILQHRALSALKKELNDLGLTL